MGPDEPDRPPGRIPGLGCAALPDHPTGRSWEMLRRALGDDNWGNWEIEDATIYHGVWLYALCGLCRAMGELEELFKTPEMYYYAQYFLHLMCPDGMIPDFGDANWHVQLAALFGLFRSSGHTISGSPIEMGRLHRLPENSSISTIPPVLGWDTIS